MTTSRIPVRRDIFDYTLEPEGLGISLRFNYNSRIDSWVMDIVDQVNGIKVVGGIDLFANFRYKGLPDGTLTVVDLDEMNREPTKDTFGDRVILVYEI